METFKESEVTAICYLGLRAVQKGGENYGSVNTDLGFAFQVFVVPHPFVESAKGTVSLCKSVVDFPINSGIR